MRLRSTVDVVWRADREKWVVEGGNGRTAVLGICSVHSSKEAAIDVATDVADQFGARVRVLNEPGDEWPKLREYGVDVRPDGGVEHERRSR